MSVRAHVATKYVVDFGFEIGADDFDKKLEELQQYPEYADIVDWADENHENYELNKELLENIRDDANQLNIPEYLRKFAKDILGSCDPELDYVRVELF